MSKPVDFIKKAGRKLGLPALILFAAAATSACAPHVPSPFDQAAPAEPTKKTEMKAPREQKMRLPPNVVREDAYEAVIYPYVRKCHESDDMEVTRTNEDGSIGYRYTVEMNRRGEWAKINTDIEVRGQLYPITYNFSIANGKIRLNSIDTPESTIRNSIGPNDPETRDAAKDLQLALHLLSKWQKEPKANGNFVPLLPENKQAKLSGVLDGNRMTLLEETRGHLSVCMTLNHPNVPGGDFALQLGYNKDFYHAYDLDENVQGITSQWAQNPAFRDSPAFQNTTVDDKLRFTEPFVVRALLDAARLKSENAAYEYLFKNGAFVLGTGYVVVANGFRGPAEALESSIDQAVADRLNSLGPHKLEPGQTAPTSAAPQKEKPQAQTTVKQSQTAAPNLAKGPMPTAEDLRPEAVIQIVKKGALLYPQHSISRGMTSFLPVGDKITIVGEGAKAEGTLFYPAVWPMPNGMLVRGQVTREDMMQFGVLLSPTARKPGVQTAPKVEQRAPK